MNFDEMGLDELTGPITELAIAWSEGDRESGEILFRRILKYLRPAAARFAWQCADRSTTDVINSAYEQICKYNPSPFESRYAFVRIYIQAMKFWLADYRRYWKAEMRAGAKVATASELPDDADQQNLALLLDTQDALNRLQENKLIDETHAQMFIDHHILGVSQSDLAEIYSVTRQTVAKYANLVARLLSKELGDDYRPRNG